jgi:hypothetical protein
MHRLQNISVLLPGGFLIAIGTLLGSLIAVWACAHWMFNAYQSPL